MNYIKICNRCVMDTTANDIWFNDDGNCNYCSEMNDDFIKPNLTELLVKIKASKKNNEYDCLVGLSGGVDSAWTLLKVVEMGLNPLAVHMDNGWNTELAQNNIHNLVKKLKVDLYTEVLDWDKYRSLMKSFFMSDVVDIELLYDNAMFAANYFQARKHNIKYILAGTNNSTEGMRIPSKWNWYKYDKKNIKDINYRFKNISLNNYPMFSTFDYIYLKFFKKIKWISFLDHIDYNKNEAEKYLSANYNFKPYPYKHYESFFTKFYQSYILPNKFNIDKRKCHLSSLIISNQITRNEALQHLNKKPYNEITIQEDIKYFLKKMNWDMDDLNNYIKRKRKDHNEYKTELPIWEFLNKIYKILV